MRAQPRGVVIAASFAFLLSACGGGSGEQEQRPEPVPSDVDPAALVAERYADCLDQLDATEPVASEDGTTVTATAEGVILTWDVGEAPNTGDPLTVPADTETLDALATVGC
jgi:hypothetical protein